MKTFTATPADIVKKWVLIDAEGVVLLWNGIILNKSMF
jgi:ribosomal protein L13